MPRHHHSTRCPIVVCGGDDDDDDDDRRLITRVETRMVNHTHTHVNDRCRRMDERSKVIQTSKQSNRTTPKAVTFPKKDELLWVGFEPTTLRTLDRAFYQLSYRGSYTCTHTHSPCKYIN